MILDITRFLERERPFWDELDRLLSRLESDLAAGLSLEEAQRLHYLQQRTASDLARLRQHVLEPALAEHLERLVARAYAVVHEGSRQRVRFHPVSWFFGDFPSAVRRRWRALAGSVAATMIGALFGGILLLAAPDAKMSLVPPQFDHLFMDPSERVAMEEAVDEDRLEGGHAAFAAMLMTHNTRVSILTFSLGFFWGLGTIIMLFYNGVILGTVAADFFVGGEGVFLTGWLLPHGSIEIPAILIAGQAGLVLGGAVLGNNSKQSFRTRMRGIGFDVMTLVGGAAVLLIWAGLVESYVSQYHQPALPYALKIAFGILELAALAALLIWGGRWQARKSRKSEAAA